MVQSARKSAKTSLSIEIILGKTISKPPLRWAKWRTQLDLAILAKEYITLNIPGTRPTKMKLHLEYLYGKRIENATDES